MFKIVVILSVVGMGLAAMERIRIQQKPDEFAHKEGCYINEVNDVVAFGSSVSAPGYCYSIKCNQNGLTSTSCGVMVVAENSDYYITKEDLSKPYPDCCPRVERKIKKA